jgi:molybdenum-dependent DNA-binding transcriptional regulator ModE
MDDHTIPPPPPEDDGPPRRNNSNHMFMTPHGQRARDAWAAERQAVDGWEYRQIAKAMDISVSTAWARVQRGLRIIDAPALLAAERARAAHRARLEAAAETVMEIMARDHVHVSQGRVMKDDNGIPLIDDGPKLAAAEKIRALSESLRKLDGLDAATKVDTSITITPQDAELQVRGNSDE